MKKSLKLLALMILPSILLLLILILQNSRGEYYLNNNYDGPYGFLLGSLNLANFEKPGYFQHPGIVPQLIIAFIIKLTYLIRGVEPNVIMDTFSRPEFYFNRINFSFALIMSVALYLTGRIILSRKGDIFAAIFIQLTPFVSVLLLYLLACNTVEVCILVLVLSLITLVYCYLNESALTNSLETRYMILFGINGGLLLATLISNLPILLIPFMLLKRKSQKIYFVLISLVVFMILFFLISPDSFSIWKFVISNVIHSGKYGSGPANFIDFSRIIPSIELIWKEVLLFSIVYLLLFITIVLQFVPAFKNRMRSNRYFLSLICIFLIMSMYILLVIKQKEGYYVLPGVMFTIFTLFALNSIYIDLFPRISKIGKYSFIIVIVIVFMIPLVKTYKNYLAYYNAKKQESYKIIKYLNENFPNRIVISSDQTASMPTAFYNGLNYTGHKTKYYISILENKYPNYVYFQRYRKEFIYLDNTKEIKSKLLNSDTLIFHSVDDANFNDFKTEFIKVTKKPDAKFEQVFANKNGEKIFLITTTKSNQPESVK